MLAEDILDFDNLLAGNTERRHRALHKARANYASTTHATSRIALDHRGRRALRKAHPSDPHPIRRVAPRARHLSYNRFTRPARRRRLNEDVSTEILDRLSITGGWNCNKIFIKIELDVSKEGIDDIKEVILKPLRLLNETDFLKDMNLFDGGDSALDSVFDDLDLDISFSAGAHMGATGKQLHCDISKYSFLMCH